MGCGSSTKESIPKNLQPKSSNQNRMDSKRSTAPTVDSSTLPVLKNAPPSQQVGNGSNEVLPQMSSNENRANDRRSRTKTGDSAVLTPLNNALPSEQVKNRREELSSQFATVPVQKRPPTMSNRAGSSPSVGKEFKSPTPSYSDGDNDKVSDDDDDDEAAAAATNVHGKSSRSLSYRTPLPTINSRQTPSKALANHGTRTNTITSRKSPEAAGVDSRFVEINTSNANYSKTHAHHSREGDYSTNRDLTAVGHCSLCPHCQKLSEAVSPAINPDPQLKWITRKAPSKKYQHIAMDDYDEEAFQRKVSKSNHVTGSYNYSHNLKIEEEEDDGVYCTFPFIAKIGSSITPTHTPFPNYDALQRYDKRFNKPYTLTLFTD